MAPANEKQQAHQLLDQLDAGQLSAVVHLLQVMTCPLSRSLGSAPVEEEEITPETAAGLDRAPRFARAWRRHSPRRHLARVRPG